MIKYISNRIKQIENIYKSNQNRLSIVILNAMEGMGKKTSIQAFLNETNCNNIVQFDAQEESIFPFSSFVSSFNNNSGGQNLISIEKIKIQQYLKNRILDILAETSQLFVIFNRFNKLDAETAFFVFDLAKMLINLDSKKTIMFFITFDETITFEERNRIKNLSRYTHYVNFPDWNSNDLTQLLYEEYPYLCISKKHISEIIHCSFKNAGIFLNNIEYLKQLGYICLKGQTLVCCDIPNGILYENYKEVIQTRYNNLEPNLKEALEKASLLGVNFDALIIQNALCLDMAAQLMHQIERISRLISQVDNNESIFEFINTETHHMIKLYISDKNKIAWSFAIAVYYETQLMDPLILLSDIKFCEYAICAALYYEHAQKYDKALSLYIKTIPMLINQELFRKSLDIIDKSQKLIIKLINIPKRVQIQLQYWTYQCNYALYNIKEGLKSFQNYRKKVDINDLENIRADYCESKMLYDADQTNIAYTLVKDCYDKLNIIEQPNKDVVQLKIQVITLLCTVEETLLLSTYENHFEEALCLARQGNSLDVYYSLLRISGIVYSGKKCINYLNDAASYFSKKNKLEYAMTLHNLGSELIFYNDPTKSLINFKESYKIFSNYGHNGIVSVRNGLSIYYSIYKQEYALALDYIYNFSTDYNEEFLLLVICYNLITLFRKLERMVEAEEYLQKAISINQRTHNQYPYFVRFLYAQEGYLAYENRNFEKAWDCFKAFFYHDYQDRIEYSISIAITMSELAKRLNISLPQDIYEASIIPNKLAKQLSKEKLIFCEVLFWE